MSLTGVVEANRLARIELAGIGGHGPVKGQFVPGGLGDLTPSEVAGLRRGLVVPCAIEQLHVMVTMGLGDADRVARREPASACWRPCTRPS